MRVEKRANAPTTTDQLASLNCFQELSCRIRSCRSIGGISSAIQLPGDMRPTQQAAGSQQQAKRNSGTA